MEILNSGIFTSSMIIFIVLLLIVGTALATVHFLYCHFKADDAEIAEKSRITANFAQSFTLKPAFTAPNVTRLNSTTPANSTAPTGKNTFQWISAGNHQQISRNGRKFSLPTSCEMTTEKVKQVKCTTPKNTTPMYHTSQNTFQWIPVNNSQKVTSCEVVAENTEISRPKFTTPNTTPNKGITRLNTTPTNGFSPVRKMRDRRSLESFCWIPVNPNLQRNFDAKNMNNHENRITNNHEKSHNFNRNYYSTVLSQTGSHPTLALFV